MWAHNLIEDLKSDFQREAASNNIGDFARGALSWAQLVKLFNQLQFSMHKHPHVEEALPKNHEFLSAALLMVGTCISERMPILPTSAQGFLEILGITPPWVEATLQDVRDSYATWHSEISGQDSAEILAALGLGID